MTTNVLPDRVIRTVFFSLPAAIAVFCWHVVVDHPVSLGNSRRTFSGAQNIRIQLMQLMQG
jgi:hypothetical protein